VTDLIADGYDLAIRGGHIVDSSLISRPVCQLKTALVASPGYLERCGVPTTPDDLAHHHLIARRFLVGAFRLGVQGTGRQPDDAGTRRSGCDPLRTGSSNAGCAFRIGIAQVGVHHALVHLQSGALKTVLVGQHDPGNYEMVIQYPHRALVAPRVKATVEYLLEPFTRMLPCISRRKAGGLYRLSLAVTRIRKIDYGSYGHRSPSPMINTLHIQNYRSIRDMSLELEQLNIVFGPNGTGKSNIYKAIHLMHSAAQGQFSQALANEGGILKVFWAGKTRSDQLRRMNLVETETYEYELQVGFVEKLPYPRSFSSTR
jgi:hypothetical protein